MEPIIVNKGDMICFDTSIIHASGLNKSKETRIVACGALLPNEHQQVEFLLKNKTVYKYYINSDYWFLGRK